MKLTILALLLFSTMTQAQDRYILPQDIIVERDKVVESKRKLELSILKAYYRLCNQKSINQAEHIEMLAYEQVTGDSCVSLIFRR